MKQELIDAGYTYEPYRLWSFSSVLRSEGYFYKDFPSMEDENLVYQVGVLLNEEYSMMEVYICQCIVGCCGVSYGCHPFSLSKIDELLNQYKEEFK